VRGAVASVCLVTFCVRTSHLRPLRGHRRQQTEGDRQPPPGGAARPLLPAVRQDPPGRHPLAGEGAAPEGILWSSTNSAASKRRPA